MRFDFMDPRHIPAVARLQAVSVDEPWNERMLAESLANGARFVVGTEGDELVCYAGYIPAPPDADLVSIAVEEAWRRQGLGRRLLAYMLEDAAKQGVSRMVLEVNRANLAAIALYSGLGFKPVGVRKRYYEGKYDALIMRLDMEGRGD